MGPRDLESVVQARAGGCWSQGGGGAASPGQVWKLGQGVLMHRIRVQEERAEGYGAATSAVAE